MFAYCTANCDISITQQYVRLREAFGSAFDTTAVRLGPLIAALVADDLLAACREQADAKMSEVVPGEIDEYDSYPDRDPGPASSDLQYGCQYWKPVFNM